MFLNFFLVPHLYVSEHLFNFKSMIPIVIIHEVEVFEWADLVVQFAFLSEFVVDEKLLNVNFHGFDDVFVGVEDVFGPFVNVREEFLFWDFELAKDFGFVFESEVIVKI